MELDAGYLRVASRSYGGPTSWDGVDGFRCVSVSLTPGTFTTLPGANAQSVRMNEDTAKSITLSASDAGGDALTYGVVSQPSNGTLSGTMPNLIYTPQANYYGTDSFTFKANDGTADSNIATVTITVISVNDIPVANAQSTTVQEDSSDNSITLSASDMDGDSLTYLIVSYPSNGQLSGTAPNLSYRPNASFSSSDGFTFKVSDSKAVSSVVTVSIVVQATPKLQDYGLPLPPQITWNKDSAEMSLIPAGSFEMGDHLNNRSDTLPVHTVELDAFYMDVNEVTVRQFKQFVQQSGYTYGGWNYVAKYSPTDDHPVVGVNWNDAIAYARWAGKRLPTEAEWE